MKDVAHFISEPLLVADAARAFHRRRKRVAARHQSWRKNFPAVGLLLDSDEDRAQALAGNYATEARETVGVWLATLEEGAAADVGVGEQIAWIEGFWDAWRRQVLATDDYDRLEEGPRQRFDAIFDDLTERFRDDAVLFVRDGDAREPEGPTLAARLTAPLRALAGALEGFFFPSVKR